MRRSALLLALLVAVPLSAAHSMEPRSGTMVVVCASAGDGAGTSASALCHESEGFDVSGGDGNWTASVSWPASPGRTLEVCLAASTASHLAPSRFACVVAQDSAVLTLPASAADARVFIAASQRLEVSGPYAFADAVPVEYTLAHEH